MSIIIGLRVDSEMSESEMRVTESFEPCGTVFEDIFEVEVG